MEQIIAGFEQVIYTLNRLCRHILDELADYPIWIDNGAGDIVDDRDRLIYVLKHFNPTQGLTPQETFACPGAVGANLKTLDLIKAVNQAKASFSQIMHDYLTRYHIQDTAVIRQALASANYSNIKLKQVCRQIVTLDYHPRRIAFTKARNGSNKSITIQQAEQSLLEAGHGLHIDVQLTKLSILGTQDKLAIHREMKPYSAVNISTFKNETGHSTTTKKHTSLPIFYLHDKQLPKPTVVFSKKISRAKGARADKKLEDKPFLPSISAYRYKNR